MVTGYEYEGHIFIEMDCEHKQYDHEIFAYFFIILCCIYFPFVEDLQK